MQKKTHRKNKKGTRILVIGIVIVLAVVLLTLELTNVTHLFHDRSPKVPATTASQNTKGEPLSTQKIPTTKNNTSPQPATSSDTTQPGDQKSNASTPTTVNLIAPSGDFVSAHKNLKTNTPLTSVCNTSPGASCKITFTSGTGIVVSLPTQTTDRGGSTYWNSWTPKSIGITSGTWKIQAVATLNNQTTTADDALTLEVLE